jgi:dihydroorotase
MIDPHVHLRDWKQKEKETVEHGLSVAYQAGLDAVFEMPNTDPPLVSKESISKRIQLADSFNMKIFHGLYAGLTAEAEQIKTVVELHQEFFPRIVGLKLYAGPTTSSGGSLDVAKKKEKELVFNCLVKSGYTGILAVHCEKEDLIQHDVFSPANPFSHTLARPPLAETESVREIVSLAEKAGFAGTLHICHVSLAESVRIIDEARQGKRIKITCGVTPHHLLLDEDAMKTESGHLFKVNPPLRSPSEKQQLFGLLVNNKINWIETDHAPHKKSEKRTASGLPGFPVYPHLIKWLMEKGLTVKIIRDLTHNNIERAFGFSITNTNRPGDENLASEYEFDPYESIFKL